jgi:hypothetical protein
VIVAAFLLGGPVAGFAAALVAAGAVVLAAIRINPARGGPERRVVRNAAARFAAPVLLGAVGIAVTLASDGIGEAIGWGLIAIAITITMSLVFLEVGLSEDRARDRRTG